MDRLTKMLLPEKPGTADVGDMNCEGVWVKLVDGSAVHSPGFGVLDNQPFDIRWAELGDRIVFAPNALGDEFRPVIVALAQ